MRYLVTGGAGFIGSHVVERLLKDGNQVVCVDTFTDYYDPKIKEENIKSYTENDGFKVSRVDISNLEAIENVIKDEGIETIIHEAAQAGVRASVENPMLTHTTNATGTMNILKASLDSDVKKIVNASSSSVYGKVEYLPFDEGHPKTPLSPYAVSKLAAENYCRVFNEIYGLDTTSLRYFTVYGPRMRPDLAISIFTGRALRNETIDIFGDGTKTRDFTFIDDSVDATLLAVKGKPDAYNIGGSSRISINELAEKIIEITGSSSKISHTEDVKGDAIHTLADNQKARKELGWKPVFDIDKGLKTFIEWYKKR